MAGPRRRCYTFVGSTRADRMMPRLKQFLSAAILIGASTTNVFADGKILLGPHSGDATIVTIAGVNSDRAVVKFRRELDDEVEDCVREGGEGTNSQAVARCVKEGMAREANHTYTRRAFCSRLTLYTEFGNFSMVNHEREKARCRTASLTVQTARIGKIIDLRKSSETATPATRRSF